MASPAGKKTGFGISDAVAYNGRVAIIAEACTNIIVGHQAIVEKLNVNNYVPLQCSCTSVKYLHMAKVSSENGLCFHSNYIK